METHQTTAHRDYTNRDYTEVMLKQTKKNYGNFFLFLTHQLIFAYFFDKIISYFAYIFQSKFLTYVCFSHDYIFFDVPLY